MSPPFSVPAIFVGLISLTFATPGIAQTSSTELPSIKGTLTLMQTLQIGLKNNLMLSAVREDINAALQETRIAKSQMRPQLSANVYTSFGDYGNILSSAGNVTPTNYLSVPSQGFADLNLTLMVPLYTNGRLQAGVRTARERERATLADVGGVEQETMLRITDAYYRTLLAGELAKTAQARLDADNELVKNTQALFSAGKGLEASVLRSKAERADAQRALTTSRNTERKALLDLKTVMGVRLDSEIVPADTLTFTPLKNDLLTEIANAQKERPELRAAKLRASAFSGVTQSRQGAQGVQVYGMAMADGFTSGANRTREGYTVALVVSLPVFDGGQRKAETSLARAQQRRAEAEARDLELRVENEVRQAWLDVETAEENYRTAQSALLSAKSAYDVTTLRVQNGKGLLVEQLDALASFTLAQSNLAQSLYDHALSVSRLRRATGKPTLQKDQR